MSRIGPGVSRKNLLDSIAIGVSFACLVHCLVLPLLVAFLPAWSAWLELPRTFHFWVIAFALPFSLGVLLQAARKHGWFAPLLVGTAGLLLMAIGLTVQDSLREAMVTSSGAALLAAGHLMNWHRRSHWRG